MSRWTVLHRVMASLSLFLLSSPAPGAQIDYPDRAPEGLVGNGRSIVKVRADSFEFFDGGTAAGRLRLIVDGQARDLRTDGASATFFPGGVIYRQQLGDLTVDVLHGATVDTKYLVGVRVQHARGRVELEIEGRGEPALTPAGRVLIPLHRGSGLVVVATDPRPAPASWEALRDRVEGPYRQGFLLQTPNAKIDRAVPFNRFLLDLGFNGRLHVCEIFRWRDVWSRDLGSGLAPGAMVDGAFDAARTTIEYDLARHARANPHGYRVTQDTSQGGSAEGVAWLVRAAWQYYLLTGDREFLTRVATTMRPWVDAWIERDADQDGLLVDVTEWMDHSRFFLFPDGARVLYSNALFAELLGRFARIERELGDAPAAVRLEQVQSRFVRAINARLWNESAGRYDNLRLWGIADERSSSEGNMLAVLGGVAPPERVGRIFDAIRTTNWQAAGSTTITPPMTHVDAHNDHNFKVWPWWNAVEARARFLHGDTAGAVHLLEAFSDTLEDPHYPGLVEELTTPDGVTEGGQAFVTAAGAYQDAIFSGLLGIDILQAGRARIRVTPNVPTDWQDWRAEVPLPQGVLRLIQANGHLRIEVTDPQVRVVETRDGVEVVGATREPVHADATPALAAGDAPEPLAPPPLRPRQAATFVEEGIPSRALAGLPTQRIGAEDLLTLDPAKIAAVVVPGDALPRRTRSGADVETALARYLDAGGALVFHGATMRDRQAMGEHGGVIDWYEFRPTIRYEPIRGWRFRASPESGSDAATEFGLVHGWQQAGVDVAAWTPLEVPRTWADHPPERWQGWEWLRASFRLPAEARGHAVVVTLGRVNSRDGTYVNGVRIGSSHGAQVFRSYWLRPGDAAYDSLQFGGDNVVAVQVMYEGAGGGLYVDAPTIGIEQAERSWQPLDAQSGEPRQVPQRHGVVSWGPGDFFNSWETSRGAFGFEIEGQGVEFVGALAGIAPLPDATHAAFTDFAVRQPWLFEPLAWTRTHRALLVPDHGERYPAVARVVNTATGGEFILISETVAKSAAGPTVLARVLGTAPGARPRHQ